MPGRFFLQNFRLKTKSLEYFPEKVLKYILGRSFGRSFRRIFRIKKSKSLKEESLVEFLEKLAIAVGISDKIFGRISKVN